MILTNCVVAAAREIEQFSLARLVTPEGMVTIPAGWFQMGSGTKENLGGYITEQPLHWVFLNSYQIDQYEVSNMQYLRCIQMTQRMPPFY